MCGSKTVLQVTISFVEFLQFTPDPTSLEFRNELLTSLPTLHRFFHGCHQEGVSKDVQGRRGEKLVNFKSYYRDSNCK